MILPLLKDHPDLRALAQLTVDLQLCIMLLHDVFDDGKSQSGAARGFRSALVHPVKSLKDPLLILFRNTDTGIFHRKYNMPVCLRHPDLDRTARVIIADRIVTQVVDQFLHHLAIGINCTTRTKQ